MISVIIAGGSGTRLWPLSTPEYPKHLLSINGAGDSLLQTTFARARELSEFVYIVTEKGHLEHVHSQLPDVNDDYFIVEPDRRGTAGCIVAALAKIAKNHGADEPVAFMHADHFIRNNDGFIATLKKAGEIAANSGKITLIGINPDYASTGFGYIKKRFSDGGEAFEVESFKEKPDAETAQRYFESGDYLWNGGYFVASLDTFLREMNEVAPDLADFYNKLSAATPDNYDETYLSFESIAIDYALIEKVPDLLVIPAEFDWMDVGSFADLHTASQSDEQGNSTLGSVELEQVNNSIVQNYEDKPLAVIGLDNIAVINTPKGIVVTHKDNAQKVGDVSKRFKK